MSDEPVEPETAHPHPLHRNRDFRRLWIGQACTELAAHGATLAYTLLALTLTGSPAIAGAVAAAGLAANVIACLPAGALIDRWDRRRTMITCEAIRAAALAGLGIAVFTDHVSLPLLISAVIIERVGSAFFLPAQTAALRHIVSPEQLPRAAARIEARAYAAELAGPPLGGALFSLARGVPFLGATLAYVISLSTIALIRRPLQEPRAAAPERLISAIARGTRFVLTEPFLRASLILAALFNLAFGGAFFTLVVVLQQRDVSPAGIGLAQSSLAVGGLLGALLAPMLQPRLRAPTLIISLSWIGAVLVGVTGLLTDTYLVTVPLIVALLLAPSLNATVFAYQIAITPDSMQGRVDNTIGMLAQGLSPLGPLVAGVLTERWNGAVTLAGFAAVLGIAAVVATASKGIRRMRPIEPSPPSR